MIEFEAFPKIPRLNRQCVITEKLDGTNAQVLIPEDDGPMLVGSRNRWITPDDDNYGFARWAFDHEAELRTGLGYGRHFGEWWGQGIQRKYGLNEKRFSLFNTARWNDENTPECCHVVPVLFAGTFSTEQCALTIRALAESGSIAAPGFMKPEGVCIWHVAAQQMFKATIEKDEEPKGRAA